MEMEMEIHRAQTRGQADHGWLKVNHTFSFAHYYNSERMGFGLLRVLNDDIIEPTFGFGLHPHRDMEIITIPLSGELHHEDTTGGSGVIHHGEVQVMSAGTGVQHTEYNHHKTERANILQTWIYPREKGLEPRYDQKKFDCDGRKDRFQLIVSPDGREGSLWINQDAFYSLADISEGKTINYELKQEGAGLYMFVVSGAVKVNGENFQARDGVAIWNTSQIELEAQKESEILLIETPLR